VVEVLPLLPPLLLLLPLPQWLPLLLHLLLPLENNFAKHTYK